MEILEDDRSHFRVSLRLGRVVKSSRRLILITRLVTFELNQTLYSKRDMREETAGSGGSRGVLPLHSLAISPNLDKLLEHDEQSRKGPVQNATLPAGLSPPPRGNRQVGYTTRSGAIERGNTTSSSGSPMLWARPSNPYINPAPIAEDGPARPATGSSQQSFYCNNEQSCSPTGFRFKVQTLPKRKFPGLS